MRAIYKCRLCGEIYQAGPSVSVDVAARCMVEINARLVSTYPMVAPAMTNTHFCGGDRGGDMGLADFQGWQAEE